LLVIEEKPGVRVPASMFLKRDRNVDGLSFARFLIEISKKRGTLH